MITPKDIETKEFKKAPFGYSNDEVDSFLDLIITDYTKLIDENMELKDTIALINEKLEGYKQLETTIQKTLILAEKTSEETKSSAYLKGEQIKREAEISAEKIIMDAHNKVIEIENRLFALKNQYKITKSKIKLLLSAELELLEQDDVLSNEENLAN